MESYSNEETQQRRETYGSKKGICERNLEQHVACDKATAWMSVPTPSKCIFWNIIPNVMAFGGGAIGRWLGHKGGALENGISALSEETYRAPFPFHHVRTQGEDFHLWTKKRALTRHQICWRLDLGLSNLQNSEKQNCIVYKSPSLRHSFIP